MKEIVDQITSDPRYLGNLEYGRPRPGHPEGKVRYHIEELEQNLEKLASHHDLSENQVWKLRFLIHVHDTFKAQAARDSAITDPQSHASLAKAFAAEFTRDGDLLNMVQFHDEGYALWKRFERGAFYGGNRFGRLLNTIKDWDLFLMFLIIDGSTEGKDRRSLTWFINEVKRYKETVVDEGWIL